MPVESAADRLAFLSVAEFGESATYAPLAGGSAALVGIFDDPFTLVSLGERAPVHDSEPSFLVRTADLPAGAAERPGGTLAIAATDMHPGATYAVIDIRPDGTGMSAMLLGAVVLAASDGLGLRWLRQRAFAARTFTALRAPAA